MFHQKNILPLIYKTWSFILVLFFLLPSGLKVIHAYSFHSTQKECKHNTTHLHSSTLHNDVLDYYFHFLAETNLAPADQLDGLYTRIEQHLGVISHAQNKIMLLQEIAEQNDEG